MSYYLMHRGWMDNPVFKEPYTRAQAWIWLIENAAFSVTKHRGRTVERGQLYTSLGILANAWKWQRPAIQRCLSAFREASMIDTASDTDGTLITLCNYEKYQLQIGYNQPASDTDPIHTRYRADTLADTQYKRIKEGKKEEEDSEAIASDVAEAPSTPEIDPIKDLFDRGVKLLVRSGVREPQARSIVGKWRKSYSDPLVMAAIARCEDEFITDPVAYITRFLDHHQRQNGNGQTPLTPASQRFIASRQDTVDAALRVKREREARERGTSGR
jgi:hypothetical protein